MSKRRKTKAGIWFSFRPIVLLVLTTAFLVLTTYAWFTSNTLVQIESLEIYVQASEGFQISLDAINWKTIIQASEITGTAIGQPYNVNNTYIDNKNHVPAEMRPVSTGLATDNDGYMNMFLGAAELDERVGSPTRNEYVFSTQKITEERGQGPDGGDFIAFDLFFKTSFDIELHLDYGADAVDNAAADSPEKDKGMENSSRIAFVRQGSIPMSTNMSGNAIISQAQGLKHTATSDRKQHNNMGTK